MECPDVSESVECRVYDAVTLQHLSTFTGHHAFSLKNAIFFLYLDSLLFQSNDGSANNGSIEDTCDLIASGSEEHNIYIWHRRQERLVQVLRGHTNTVSTVTFNPVFPGVLASGADDFSCKIWVSETILPRNSAAIVMNQDI
jgi:WD40 repeat protein